MSSPMPKHLPTLIAISLGPSFGLFIMNGNVQADPAAGISKFDYTEKYMQMFGGDE